MSCQGTYSRHAEGAVKVAETGEVRTGGVVLGKVAVSLCLLALPVALSLRVQSL